MVRKAGPSIPKRGRSQRGASAAEYGLIAVLVAVVIIASVTLLGTRAGGLFQKTCASFPSAGASTC
jgi:Flp pilus assembly pilin Flp